MSASQSESALPTHSIGPTGFAYEVATQAGRFYLPYRGHRWDLEQRIADGATIEVSYVPEDQFAAWLASDQIDTYRGAGP